MAYGAILGQGADTYSKEQIMASSIPSLYGLSASAVPSDVLQLLSNSVLLENAGLILPQSASWYGSAFGNGRFVAVASGQSTGAYSDDGINWLPMNMPYSIAWRAVAYGNGRFVAVANNNTLAAYSDDGITWKQSNMPVSAQWASVTYGNGKFVAVATGTTNAAYSEDGINWTSCNMPASRSWKSVTYGNGKFVAVSTGTANSAYSEDGINWTSSIMPASRSWYSVTYGNGMFVAVAYSSSYAAYSNDGINWTSCNLPKYANWNVVSYGGGKFVAVTTTTTAAYSNDGISWESATGMTVAAKYSVSYGNGKFIATPGQGTTMSVSADGMSWITESPTLIQPNGTPLINAMKSVLGLPGVQISTGAYIGTGTYGQDNPVVIDAGFEFVMAIVYTVSSSSNTDGLLPDYTEDSWTHSMIYTVGQTATSIEGYRCMTEQDDTTLTLYLASGQGAHPEGQLNESGQTYRYIFIGR